MFVPWKVTPLPLSRTLDLEGQLGLRTLDSFDPDISHSLGPISILIIGS